MKCECEYNPDGMMELVAVWDSPNDGYAYNLFHCKYCGRICKNDVWENAGNFWIDIEGKLSKHEKLVNKP